MQYSIVPSVAPHVTQLQVPSVSKLIAGAALGLIGAGLIALGATGVVPGLPALTAYGFGLTFLSGALLAVTSGSPPGRLVFDDQQAALLVHEAGAGEPGRLSYAAIAGFSVREVRSTQNQHTTVHYRVVMDKQDGGFWQLGEFRDRAAADALCSTLGSSVDLSREPSRAPDESRLSGALTESRHDAFAELRWRRRVHPLAVLTFLGVPLGLGLATHGGRGELPGVVYWAVIALLGLIVLATLATTLLSIGKECVIRVDSEKLHVRETGGVLGFGFEMPLAEIRAVTFLLTPSGADSSLLVLDERGRRALDEARAPASAASAFESALSLLQAKRIGAADLDTATKLALERWLEREIRARGGDAR
ncbi:MAG: hypothetical protein KF718_02095 [Polyangiaceae bacterium]|nr:hypothetical protein [Polyangiaceae bacterium]